MTTGRKKSTTTRKTKKTSASGNGRSGGRSTTGRRTSAASRNNIVPGGDVVIVESPAKARTLSRILGNRYNVLASVGHVRDLPKSKLAIDVERDFAPDYVVPRDKSSVVKEIKAAASAADTIYLATDPDREGEAISWHLMQAAGIPQERMRRVVFHEVTENAVLRAFDEPRGIDEDLVNAYQARRVLDRLVGYRLSPVLWSKVRKGLSAGRVQSAALRLVVEREAEIDAFVPQEYWEIDANLATQAAQVEEFSARYRSELDASRAAVIPNQEMADRIVADLNASSYQVASVRRRETTRRPGPPFITSTLQQEAFRKLRFTARRTMTIAQQLYEGLPIGNEGPIGLITYMRTDSTNMANEAVQEARAVIGNRYGKDHVPASPRSFSRRVKGAQEAHEAIRPTSFMRDPESLRNSLSREQFNLYQLIWQRALASQMADAKFDQTTVDITASGAPSGVSHTLRVSGSIMTFAGFLAVYREGLDEPDAESDEGRVLPDLQEGQALILNETRLQQASPAIVATQRFTQPPPRFTEATLIRALEERGIGRPSTYAAILSTIQDRGYVDKADNRFRPLKLGTAVSGLLAEYFPQVSSLDFTSRIEEELDDVARGEREWVPVLRDFYGPFNERIDTAQEKIERVRNIDEETDEACPECDANMVIKRGRFGPFLSCSRFPECRGMKRIQKSTGAQCPDCSGELVQRSSRKSGRPFYGCSSYPNCNFLTNQEPLPQPCPDCGGLVVASSRTNAACHNKECGWQGSREELTTEQPQEDPQLVEV
jgi:DNA topoisomerase-1